MPIKIIFFLRRTSKRFDLSVWCPPFYIKYAHLYDEEKVSKEYLDSVNPEIENAVISIRNGDSESVPNVINATKLDEKTIKAISKLVGFDVSGYMCKIDGTYCVSQVVPDSKNKTVWIATARIQKADVNSQVPHSRKTTPWLQTSETPLNSSSASDNIVARDSDVVNSKINNDAVSKKTVKQTIDDELKKLTRGEDISINDVKSAADSVYVGNVFSSQKYVN